MKEIQIGKVPLQGRAVLAPMAGVTDRAFREMAHRFGAACVTTEMVSAKALEMGDKKTRALMEIGGGEHPCAIQIFGSDPKTMAAGARRAMEFGPDFLDINMGCPVPKVAGNGAGSALMKNPSLCGEIVAAVHAAAPVPVTVKIRKGWDSDSVNACEVARICERAGAAAVAVHARTRAQMYTPPADWDCIRQVKQSVQIPVIGNGDIQNAQDADRMLRETGCDAVMVGRAALGNPWIFFQLNAYLNNSATIIPPPGLFERLTVMLQQMERMCAYKGERRAMQEARKHVGWYLKGLRGAAAFRRKASSLSSMQDLAELTREILEQNQQPPEPPEPQPAPFTVIR